jgi:glycosyltransferase involved in cell wall biosynthesis
VLWLAKGLGRGGAERLLVNGARHRDADRYRVEAAYLLPWKDALAEELAATGVRVHCLGRGAEGTADPGWPLRLAALLRAGRYDLVHTHMPVPAAAARVLTAGLGGTALTGRHTVLVHTEHNMWPRYRRPTRWANAATYRRNAAVIAVSRGVAETIPSGWLPGGSRDALHTIHHGPDLGGAPVGTAARKAARAALGIAEDALVVGTVANFTPKKDQRTLLAAHQLLRAEHPQAVLVLIGSGPLEDELRARARALGIADSVVFAGSRPDVPMLLPGFDVFTLSSLQEGLPVSLMEAMSTGLPSVLTAVGGIPEIVDDGVEGLTVLPERPRELAAALAALAADPARRARVGAAARSRSMSFDVRASQAAIEAVYESALRSRGPGSRDSDARGLDSRGSGR